MKSVAIRKKLQEAEVLRNKEQNLKAARKALRDVFKRTRGSQTGIQVYLPLATLELDLGNVPRAKTLFEEGIVCARRFDERVTRADLLRKYAYVVNKFEKHSYRRALSLAEEAIRICKKEKGKEVQKILASAYAAKGNILYDAKKTAAALGAYRSGLRIAERACPERALTIRNDIANVFLARRQYRQARLILERVIVDAARFYRHAFPAGLLRMAYLFFKQRDYGKSYAYAVLSELAARGNAEDGVWKRELAESLELKGTLLRRLGERKRGNVALTDSLKLYRELGYDARVRRLERVLRGR